MWKRVKFPAVLAFAVFISGVTARAGDLHLGYQGRMAVGGVNFEGSGTFRFTLVAAGGAGTTLWDSGLLSLTVTGGR